MAIIGVSNASRCDRTPCRSTPAPCRSSIALRKEAAVEALDADGATIGDVLRSEYDAPCMQMMLGYYVMSK